MLQALLVKCSRNRIWSVDLNVQYLLFVLVLPYYLLSPLLKVCFLSLYYWACYFWLQAKLIELFFNFKLPVICIIYFTYSLKIETIHLSTYTILDFINSMKQVSDLVDEIFSYNSHHNRAHQWSFPWKYLGKHISILIISLLCLRTSSLSSSS